MRKRLTVIYLFFLKNTGFALLTTNIILIAFVFVQYDPFKIFNKGYSGSPPIVAVERSQTSEITIESASGIFKIIRGTEIKDPDLSSRKQSIFSSNMLQEERTRQFSWKLEYSQNGKTRTFKADEELISKLFAALEESKRYYFFSRTAEKEKDAGLHYDENKKCSCIKISIKKSNGKINSILSGRNTAAGETHVAVNGENLIYLVQTDLNQAAGYGDPEYFRNRKLFPPEVNAESITGISIVFKHSKTKHNVRLEKAGGVWQMIAPENTAASIGNLAEKIADLKADKILSVLPGDLNKQDAFKLKIIYKTSMTESGSFQIEAEGRKDTDVYYFNDNGEIFEVYSHSLDDFFHPEERLVARENLLK